MNAYSVPSKSRPGESHTVTVDDNGKATCDCKAFHYRRTCSHVTQVKEPIMTDPALLPFDRLNAPLNPARVSVRKQGGQEIAYLEGHDVIAQANWVFGIGGWGYQVHGMPVVVDEGTWGERHTPYKVWAVSATVTIKNGETFSDIGTNTQNGTGAAATEMAIKGAATDAVKRCLKNLGDQFGLILYDKTVSPEEVTRRWREYQPNGPIPQMKQGEDEEQGEPPDLLAALSGAFRVLEISDPAEKLEALSWFTGWDALALTLPDGKLSAAKVESALLDWGDRMNTPPDAIVATFLKAMRERS